MMKTKLYKALAMMVLLSGCATNEPIEDKSPHLGPGQGIAAVVVDASDEITQLAIRPISGKGSRLTVPSVPAGKHVYLFVTDAGTYCIHSFAWSTGLFIAPTDDQCFEVRAGEMAYSGVYSPLVGVNVGLGPCGGMNQKDDWDNFVALLKSTYPNIAAATFATDQTVAKEEAASQPPPPPNTGICNFMNAAEASDLLGVKTDAGHEVNAFLISACLYSGSDQQVVHLSRLPGSDVGNSTLESVTPSPEYGWSKAIDIPGLGDGAHFTSRGNTSELVVLQKKKVLFLLTVDGSMVPNLQDAMTQAAKILLTRFLEHPEVSK